MLTRSPAHPHSLIHKRTSVTCTQTSQANKHTNKQLNKQHSHKVNYIDMLTCICLPLYNACSMHLLSVPHTSTNHAQIISEGPCRNYTPPAAEEAATVLFVLMLRLPEVIASSPPSLVVSAHAHPRECSHCSNGCTRAALQVRLPVDSCWWMIGMR
jgi:hypothetical protein